MKKKMMVIGLAAVMSIGTILSGMTAYADGTNEPEPIQDVYEIDDVCYFNVNSSHVKDSTHLFYKDCLNAQNPTYLDVDGLSITSTETTGNLWLYAALAIQQQLGARTGDAYFKSEYDNVLWNYINKYSLGTSINLESGVNDYNVNSTGLQYANSMANAGKAIDNKLYSYYDGAGGSRDQYDKDADDAAVWTNSTLSDNTTTQDVFWSLISANKTSGTYKKGHYQALAVLFSDFTVTPIIPGENTETQINYVTEEPTENPKISTAYSAGVINDSATDAEKTQSLSTTTSFEAYSEETTGREYSYQESIGIDVQIGRDTSFVNAGVSLGFTAGQVLQSSWMKGKSEGTSTTYTSEVTVPVPAYTQRLIATEEENWTAETFFNCPLAVGFKVTVVEYTLDPSSNSADASTKVLATYQSGQKDLYKYVVTEKDTLSADGVNWAAANTAIQNAANKLATTVPTTGTGASIKMIYKVLETTLNEVYPIYPLYEVRTVENVNEISLSLGEYVYLNTIDLKGYNQKGGVYYGFDSAKGSWVLLDETATNEIGNGTAETAAQIVMDAGKAVIKAQNSGVVYLKYVIDENCYRTASDANTFAKNTDLNSTAIIKVNVKNTVSTTSPQVPEQTEEIKITATRDVLFDKLNELETVKGLKENAETPFVCFHMYEDEAAVIPTGKVVLKEDASNLATGTYYMRANIGNTYSKVITVEVVDNVLTELRVPDKLEIKAGEEIDLSSLYVQGYDQNGQTFDITDLEWKNGADTIPEGKLTLDEAGTYTITAVSAGVDSNEMIVKVLAIEDEDSSDNGSSDDGTSPEDKDPAGGTTGDDTTGKDESSNKSEQSDDKAVKTGDNSSAGVWLRMLSIAFAAIVVSRSFGKNKKHI